MDARVHTLTTDDPVIAAIRRSVSEILPGADLSRIAAGVTLTDLGCNSIDRAEVVSTTMEALGVAVPVGEFHEVRDIASLAAVLRRHLS